MGLSDLLVVISNFFVMMLPKIVASLIIITRGLIVSGIVALIPYAILRFLKVDDKFKLKFLDRKFKLSIWISILIALPVFLIFLQTAVESLDVRIYFFVSYLKNYLYYIYLGVAAVVIFCTFRKGKRKRKQR